jgi:metallo-beta-lactamase superfamily protein
MGKVRVFAVVVLVGICAQSQGQQSAADLLHSALAAMGGEDTIRHLSGLHFEASLIRNELEESERPEGPYILENDQVEEWRDFAHHAWRNAVRLHGPMQPEFSTSAVVVDGAASRTFDGQSAPGSGEQIQQAGEALALSPERILITALSSSDLRRLPDLVMQSVPQHAIEFTWQKSPVRIYLNAETNLPTAVEWQTAYPFGIFWSIWGDVTTRVYYSIWWLQNGIHYPLQADVFRNGMPDQTITINKIDFNPPFAADSFAISAETRAAFASRATKTIDDRTPGKNITELAPGVLFIPGPWNSTLVRQDDGIVVVEAPMSSGYSARVLEIAESKFPGVPIKAVITTSDSWPHIGGVREYVAHDVPVYVLDRTVPLIERFLRAPRTRYPDTLAKSPHPPTLRPVSAKTVIGTGPNRLEIYPIHGETSERQMVVYFPEHKLLYGSDPFQEMDGKFFYPQTVYELKSAVEREHLSVERFFMMHVGVNPWSRAVQTVKEASQGM